MKEKIILITFVLMLLTYACKDSTQENQVNNTSIETNQNTEQNIKEDFDLFYTKFIENKRFQQERIKWPLQGGIQEEGESIEWTKENWQPIENSIHDFSEDEYQIDIIKEENKVTHKIGLKNSGLGASMTFELFDDKWYLTEYVVFNY